VRAVQESCILRARNWERCPETAPDQRSGCENQA
jgi:hypothetical protein